MAKDNIWSKVGASIRRRWLEWAALLFFIALSMSPWLLPTVLPSFADERFTPAFSAALSIGTGGLVSFVFYYTVNERLERRRQELVKNGALRSYRDAKSNIVIAVLHASQKGGRNDLCADTDTIAAALTPSGFRAMFSEGKQGNEGFYAFQNQMSERTPEYDEIIFNLQSLSRAFDRLVDNSNINDGKTYDHFVRLNALVRRIEHNGAGYDESKLLCRFVWEIFAGWNWNDGYLDHDPIEHAIENA